MLDSALEQGIRDFGAECADRAWVQAVCASEEPRQVDWDAFRDLLAQNEIRSEWARGSAQRFFEEGYAARIKALRSGQPKDAARPLDMARPRRR